MSRFGLSQKRVKKKRVELRVSALSLSQLAWRVAHFSCVSLYTSSSLLIPLSSLLYSLLRYAKSDAFEGEKYSIASKK
jgi:hypothetical protein